MCESYVQAYILNYKHVSVHMHDYTHTHTHKPLSYTGGKKDQNVATAKETLFMQSDIIKNTHSILEHTHTNTQGGHVGLGSSGSCVKKPF